MTPTPHAHRQLTGRHRNATARPQRRRPALGRRSAAVVTTLVLAFTGGMTVAAAAVLGPNQPDRTSGVLSVKPGVAASAKVTTRDVGVVTSTFTVSSLPTGNGLWASLQVGPQSASEGALVKLRVSSAGALYLSFSTVRAGRERVLPTRRLPGLVKAGQQVVVQADAAGGPSSPVRGRAWVVGQTSPGWQSGPATFGEQIRVRAYLSGAATEPMSVPYRVSFPGSSGTPSPTGPASSTSNPTSSTTTSPTSTSSSTTTTTTRPTSSTTTSTSPPASGDRTPPTTSWTGGPAQGTRVTSTVAQFALSADEPADFSYQLDGGSWVTTSEALALSGLRVGVHTLKARAVDRAGNADPSVLTRTWTVVPSTPGEVAPDASLTGVPAGTTLKVYQGDLTITKPGTVIDGLDIRGFLMINAPDVTVRRSIVRGGVATRSTQLITSTRPGVVIEDTELVPDYPSANIDGLKGYGFTANRLRIHGTVDTVVIWGSNTTLTNSWLYGNQHYLNDPNQGGGPSHDDSIQVLGGDNITLRGNRFYGAYNSGLQVTQGQGPISRLTFSDNWADGGGCSVNLSNAGRPSMSGITVNDNRFGRNTRVADCPILGTRETSFTAVGNVWNDNGAPVPVRRNG